MWGKLSKAEGDAGCSRDRHPLLLSIHSGRGRLQQVHSTVGGGTPCRREGCERRPKRTPHQHLLERATNHRSGARDSRVASFGLGQHYTREPKLMVHNLTTKGPLVSQNGRKSEAPRNLGRRRFGKGRPPNANVSPLFACLLLFPRTAGAAHQAIIEHLTAAGKETSTASAALSIAEHCLHCSAGGDCSYSRTSRPTTIDDRYGRPASSTEEGSLQLATPPAAAMKVKDHAPEQWP